MMEYIHKYEISLHGITQIFMPSEAEILTVQEQDRHLYLWAKINKQNDICSRNFLTLYTGEAIDSLPDKLLYISTTQIDEYAFHIFEVLK